MRVRYSVTTKAQAIIAPSDAQAASTTGVPRRTASRWRAWYRDDPDRFGPEVRAAVEGFVEDALAVTKRARVEALTEIRRRIPTMSDTALASAYRELRDEEALLEGRVTQRTEVVTQEDYAAEAKMLSIVESIRHASNDEVEEWLEATGFDRQLLVSLTTVSSPKDDEWRARLIQVLDGSDG